MLKDQPQLFSLFDREGFVPLKDYLSLGKLSELYRCPEVSFPIKSLLTAKFGYGKCSKITNTNFFKKFSVVRNVRNYVCEKMLVFEILECGLYHEKKTVYMHVKMWLNRVENTAI